MQPTMFGVPIVPCDNPQPHHWHSDGRTYCDGIPESDDDQ